jgi:hypothetical protein
MIRRHIRARRPHQNVDPRRIPYDMFDADRTAKEVKAAKKLEGIYHKGQEKAWNGKKELAALVEKHGGINLPPEKLHSLSRIFSTIFWGELAAWKVAAELALNLEPLEAKMAATSQAHDEARHFYVLHDYLELVGYTPERLPTSSHEVLYRIVTADNLCKKLIGMQLMVEPIALTLFQMVRVHQLEPVLCELLAKFEQDEARHVALGVNYLPKLVEKMRPHELLDLWMWQLGMFMVELRGLKEMEQDFRTLGFDPREALRLGQAKQLYAGRLVQAQLDRKLPVEAFFVRVIEAKLERLFPRRPDAGLRSRMKAALHAAVHGPEDLEEYIAREHAAA